jgi:hypothetical protein
MKDFFIKASQVARRFFMSAWAFVSDKTRTGVLVVATVLSLWWLREVLAGAEQYLVVGAQVGTFAAVAAYWTDRVLYPDSRPHMLPWDTMFGARLFAEARRMVFFAVFVFLLMSWYRGSLFS